MEIKTGFFRRKDWTQTERLVCGIDVGAASTQAVILADEEILSYSTLTTGGNSAETSRKALSSALEKAGLSMKDLHYVVSTGYGRVIVPFSQRNVSEVSCHARGAHFFFPEGGTVVDMGGQDTKVIHYDARGMVTKFFFSDKCAAGCGRYIEVIADLLKMPLDEVGSRVLEVTGAVPALSSSCVLFAKSEALALLRDDVPVNTIMAAYCNSLAHIVATQVCRIGVTGQLVLTGGVAKNAGVVRSLEEALRAKAHICMDPQIAGALGAALFASAILKKASRIGG